MKRLLIAVLLFLVCQLLLAPATPAASQTNTWTPGYYMGYVNISAKSYYQQIYAEKLDPDAHGREFAYGSYDVKGQIMCTVYNEAGNAECAGNYPTHIFTDEVSTLTSPGCNWNREEISHTPFIKSAHPFFFGQGPFTTVFNIKFWLETGPSQMKIEQSASGPPICHTGSNAPLSEDPVITNWPKTITLKTTYHDTNWVGGNCIVPGFPRHSEFEMYQVTYNAYIIVCDWLIKYVDPKAFVP